MASGDALDIEHRLSAVEERSKSNTKRLNEAEADIKENTTLISAIKELAIEIKYMREDLTDTVDRVTRLENKGGESWDKFKWLVISSLVALIIGFVAASIGLQ